MACADVWSNESVQNVKLLRGFAPTVYLEQLEYDTRFLNRALKDGRSTVQKVQELLAESDIHLDPQPRCSPRRTPSPSPPRW